MFCAPRLYQPAHISCVCYRKICLILLLRLCIYNVHTVMSHYSTSWSEYIREEALIRGGMS